MRFHTLLSDRLSDAFRVSALELTSQKISEPTFEQRNDAAKKENPHAPSGSPTANAGTFPNGTLRKIKIIRKIQFLSFSSNRIETIVDNVL